MSRQPRGSKAAPLTFVRRTPAQDGRWCEVRANARSRTTHISRPGKACHRPETLIPSGALTTRPGRSVLNERCGTAERYRQYSVRDNTSSTGHHRRHRATQVCRAARVVTRPPRGRRVTAACDGFVSAARPRQDRGSFRQGTGAAQASLRRFRGRPAASSVTGLPHQDWGQDCGLPVRLPAAHSSTGPPKAAGGMAGGMTAGRSPSWAMQ